MHPSCILVLEFIEHPAITHTPFAITTLLATSLYKDSQEVENRIDEDGDGDGDDGDDGEDGSTLGGDG